MKTTKIIDTFGMYQALPLGLELAPQLGAENLLEDEHPRMKACGLTREL